MKIDDAIEFINDSDNAFGKIDSSFLDFEKCNVDFLYYLYPMMERMTLIILDLKGLFNIQCVEVSSNRTLNSILNINSDKIIDVLDDEIVYYLQYAFAEDGLRNKILHFNIDTKYTEMDILSAQYIFSRLVIKYAELIS